MEGQHAETSGLRPARPVVVTAAFVYTLLVVQMVVFIDAVVGILLRYPSFGLWFDIAVSVVEGLIAAVLLTLGARLAKRRGFGLTGDRWLGAALLIAIQWAVAIPQAVSGFYAPLFLASASTAGIAVAWLIERGRLLPPRATG